MKTDVAWPPVTWTCWLWTAVSAAPRLRLSWPNARHTCGRTRESAILLAT